MNLSDPESSPGPLYCNRTATGQIRTSTQRTNPHRQTRKNPANQLFWRIG
jgi:hypothetical protein